MRYVATFFSHYSAMLTKKALDEANVKASLSPTPRKVSSSCGTCLIYEDKDPHTGYMDSDYEAIYTYDEKSDTYRLLIENE